MLTYFRESASIKSKLMIALGFQFIVADALLMILCLVAAKELSPASGLSIGGPLVLVSAAWGFMLRQAITHPYYQTLLRMEALAGGDYSSPIPFANYDNCIGRMARAMQSLAQTAAAKAAVEAQAKEMARLNESERAEREAERAEQNREDYYSIEILTRAFERLANGHLSEVIDTPLPIKFERLRRDYNSSVDRLRQTMLSIGSSVGILLEGAQAVRNAASAPEDVLHGAKPASSQEIAKLAYSEISTAIVGIAQDAGRVRQAAAATQDDIKKNAPSMSLAVEAMAESAKSARQIDDIVSAIDEGALQSKVLALIASFEAARVRGADSGFAEGVSEVWMLAQSFNEELKKIKAENARSIERMESGMALLTEAGQCLERAVGQAGEIGDVVAGIDADAKAQALRLGAAVAANGEGERSRRSNIVMQDAAAVSLALTRETERLASLIGQFKLGRPAEASLTRREFQKIAPQAFRPASKSIALKSDRLVVRAFSGQMRHA